MQRSMRLLITLTTVGVIVMALGSNALAVPSAEPKIENQSTQTIRIGQATFAGSEFTSGQVTVLSDMNLRVGVKINSKRCFWTKKGQVWWNGGYTANGKAFEKEDTPALLCKSPKSKTGLVKVAGGKTGRKCFNEAKVGMLPPGKVAKGRVIWVSSYTKVSMHLKAHEKFHIWADCGEAWGEASASISLRLSVAMRAKGAAVVRFFADVRAKAWVDAKADIKCVPLPPGPPAPQPPPSPQPPPQPQPPPPPPGPFKVSGSTSVQATKNLQQACPPPNQSIIKTGSGFASLNSPVFTGSGSSQAAAQQNLEQQLATWRTQNQASVDAQAQAQAQQSLNSALQTCPSDQPPTLSNPTNIEEVFADGETYPNVCVTVSAKNGNSITVTFGSTYGSMGPSSVTITSSGVDRVCSTYRAPNDGSAVGKNDQIVYGAHDNTTGLNASSVSSLPFPIKAPPARP